MVLSVKDRGDIVKAAKACAICLHSSHTADRCYNKDKDIYICGVNGCQSNHHPCLLGSKDSYVTGVNVLLRQQSTAVTTACHDAYQPVGDWLEREQYVYDSYLDNTPAQEGVSVVCKASAGTAMEAKRARELDEVRAELAKPLLHGDKVMMSVMGIDVTYGMDGWKEDQGCWLF